jgi:hypothetical protein
LMRKSLIRESGIPPRASARSDSHRLGMVNLGGRVRQTAKDRDRKSG